MKKWRERVRGKKGWREKEKRAREERVVKKRLEIGRKGEINDY